MKKYVEKMELGLVEVTYGKEVCAGCAFRSNNCDGGNTASDRYCGEYDDSKRSFHWEIISRS